MSIVILVEDMTLCFPVVDIVQVYSVYGIPTREEKFTEQTAD